VDVSQFMILLLHANQPVRVTLTESMNVAWEGRFVFTSLSSSCWKKKKHLFRSEQNITRRMRKWRLLLSGMSCHVVL